jgi:hypothetical protein
VLSEQLESGVFKACDRIISLLSRHAVRTDRERELGLGRGRNLGLIYTVRVRLDHDTINRGDTVVQLTPSLTATAYIKTGKRSILRFLMIPIDEARLESGRERDESRPDVLSRLEASIYRHNEKSSRRS